MELLKEDSSVGDEVAQILSDQGDQIIAFIKERVVVKLRNRKPIEHLDENVGHQLFSWLSSYNSTLLDSKNPLLRDFSFPLSKLLSFKRLLQSDSKLSQTKSISLTEFVNFYTEKGYEMEEVDGLISRNSRLGPNNVFIIVNNSENSVLLKI